MAVMSCIHRVVVFPKQVGLLAEDFVPIIAIVVSSTTVLALNFTTGQTTLFDRVYTNSADLLAPGTGLGRMLA